MTAVARLNSRLHLYYDYGIMVIMLRDSELTNIPFYISSSGHLCRPFNHKILSVALLRLRFCSIRGNKSDLNLSAKHGISVNSESLRWR
jgi:hypothetical protein